MQKTAEFWDKMAEGYARSPIKDMTSYHQTLDRTRSHLGAGDSVAEIGCGTGTTALHLAPTVARYTATDVSPNMIAIGERKAADAGSENIVWRTKSVEDAVAADETYDAVMAFNILHLLVNVETALAGIHNQLRPGGLFISKTTCKPTKGFSLKMSLIMTVLPLMQMIGKAPFVKMRQISELERLIEAAGFQIIETGNYPAQPPARFIVARKI